MADDWRYMLSKQRHREMLSAYEETWKRAESVAHALEEESTSVSAAGENFTLTSSKLISQANDLCVELKLWVTRFELEANVEKEG